jgi:LytS/YehU family sensor histidine kinase
MAHYADIKMFFYVTINMARCYIFENDKLGGYAEVFNCLVIGGASRGACVNLVSQSYFLRRMIMKDLQSTTVECHTTGHVCYVKCLSWGAIIAGALVGIGLGFLLNLFGIAINLSAMTTTQEGITKLALGGFLGILISTIVSMFVAGWVAGYLGRGACVKRHAGMLYGFTTWCVILLASVLLASHVDQFMAYNSDSLSKTNSVTTRNMMAYKADMQAQQMKGMADAAKGNTTEASVDAEKMANVLGQSFLLAFLLFIFGALASCLGGYFGITPKGCCEANRSNGVGKKY